MSVWKRLARQMRFRVMQWRADSNQSDDEIERLRLALESIAFECAHGSNADAERIGITARNALGEP